MKGWKFWFGAFLGVAALIYFSRDLEGRAFLDSWKNIHLPRYFEGIFWFCFSFWLRCPRWKILLHGLGKIGFLLMTKAFFIGMLVNRILPARLGEIARCVILKQKTGVSLVGLVTTIAVEKAFDGMALLSLSLIALASLPGDALPAEIAALLEKHHAKIVGSALGLPLMLFMTALILPFFQSRIEEIKAHGLKGHFSHVADSVSNGLHVLGRWDHALMSALLTALVWATLARSSHCVILSFGWDLPFSAGIVLCAAIGLAVSLPQAPSFVGVYQLAVQWTMVSLYHAPVQEAKAFAVAIWITQIIPVGLIGFVCLRLLGGSISQVTQTPPPNGDSGA